MDDNHIELMHAEIDGTLSESQRAELDELLRRNPEARERREDLSRLAKLLGQTPSVSPPADLKRSILNAIQPRRQPRRGLMAALRGSFVGGEAWRYAYTFAAGIILTLGTQYFIKGYEPGFRPSDLTGTMALHEVPPPPTSQEITIHLADLSGSIRLSRIDASTVLDFGLVAGEAIEMALEYDDAQIGFAGFEQGESEVFDLEIQEKGLSLHGRSDHRYTIRLETRGTLDSNLDLMFLKSGLLIHRDSFKLMNSGVQ